MIFEILWYPIFTPLQGGHSYWNLLEMMEYTGIFFILEYILEYIFFSTENWYLVEIFLFWY